MNPENPDFEQQVRQIIEEQIEPLNLEDDDEFMEALIFFALLGVRDVETQSRNSGGGSLSDEQRAEIDTLIAGYVSARVAFLAGRQVDVPLQLLESGLTDPSLPQSLNETSVQSITTAVISNISEGKDKVREVVEKNAENRAELIKDQELGKIMSIGGYYTAQKLGMQFKEWLRTVSPNPRDIHLEQVGLKIPMYDTFPDGSFWSNELVGCKCGIKVTYQ